MRPLMPPVQTPDNLFHDGNPLTGELGTIVDAEHLNNEQAAIRDTQSELIAILTAAAMEPESTAGQLLAALNKLYAPLNDTLGALSILVGEANKLPYFTSANAASLTVLSSIGRDIIGKATVADVLTYLGLGEGSALPVGVPVPWPLPTPPQGWLKYNGAPFDKNIYPKLGAIYPGGVLPDLRGEFVRGWDDGRGINTGRALLSSEADMNKSHGHLFESSMDGGTTWGNANPYIDFNAGNSVSHTPNNIFVQVLRAQIGGAGAGWEGINNTGVRNQLSGGNESRPRNIAFNYIVRAA